MKSKNSRGKEIIKIRVEMIKIENLKAIEKIKETNWLFVAISKTNKPSARLTRKKRTQNQYERDVTRDITKVLKTTMNNYMPTN